MISREVIEGKQAQGTNEQVAYAIELPSGTSPESPEFGLWDVTAGKREDVAASHLAGDATVSGDVVTSPLVFGLTEGHTYRLMLTYVSAGNTLSTYVAIEAEF